MNGIKFKYEKLKKFCYDAFIKFGFNSKESEIITDVLLTSDIYGIDSHGIQRLVRYHKSIEQGLININAKPEIVCLIFALYLVIIICLLILH